MNSSLVPTRHYPAAILAVVVVAAYTILSANWPEIYGFASTPSSSNGRIVDRPVHLADDVMVSLRAGRILEETARPAFNRVDVAQASTSYVSPYLFAFLLTVLPENAAVMAYAALALAACALTLGLILFYARSPAIAVILIAALALTKTNVMYSLKGWDHPFQAFFLTLAACIALTPSLSAGAVLAVSLSLALGSLFRPDGILIALGVLVSLYLSTGNLRRFVIWGLLPFLVVMSATLAVNVLQFGHMTPTTARLKWGEAPSLDYAVGYLLDNSVFSLTALTVFAVLSLLFVLAWRHLRETGVVAIAAGCVATAAIAAYNSDAFEGARMFWSPACVMAALFARKVPGLAVGPRVPSIPAIGRAGLTIALLVLGVGASTLVVRTAGRAVIPPEGIRASPTAQQYVVAEWINTHLDPADGAVGLFFLGIGYHLPRFEIADFLGKADEAIATGRAKWGPPGHNKWDIDVTLEKWKPQAIIPAAPSNPFLPGAREQAISALEAKQQFGFAPALVVNERIANEFMYCYVPLEQEGVPDEWGFFLRTDIAVRHQARLTCSSRRSQGRW